MPSYFLLFGRVVPIYGICFFGGIIIAAAVGLLLSKRRRIGAFDFVCSAVYCMIGALVGSKLLFLIVSCKEIIEMQIPFWAVIKGGFVFYGGLIGGFGGLCIYGRQFHILLRPYFSLYAAILPLGHAIGRIGCFFGGCCYGVPYDGVCSVVYTETAGNTPLNVPLLPIQLIESACLLMLFLGLFALYLHPIMHIYTWAVYGIGYSVIRFCLEFFRGDRERGVYLGISTSQWISLVMFSAVLILCICERRCARTSNDL